MKSFLTITLLFINLVAFAQADSAGLKEVMKKMDKALLQKDYPVLESILNNDISYGHSNAWVESKQDIINDLKSGKLVYAKIENSSVTIAAINKDWATVRTNTNAEGLANGKAFNLKLNILEVWMKAKTGWQLIARQSIKLQ